MRIAVLTNRYGAAASNGVAQTMAAIAGRLRLAGHAVRTVVTAVAPAHGGAGQGVDWIGEDGAHLGSVLDGIAPDVVLATGSRMPRLLARLGPQPRPVCVYLQDVFANVETLRGAHVDRVVCASEFLCRHYGMGDAVIPPLVEPAAFAAVASARTHVTSFGLSRVKRPDLVNRIARRLPDIPFELFHSWGRRHPIRLLPLRLLGNVTIRPPEADPARIYGNSRLVLVTSDSEGWCRVVTEGHLAGIPAVARHRAALPESVGDGGELLGPDEPVAGWVAAIRRAFDDDAYYAGLVDRARAAAGRRAITPDAIMQRWQDILSDACRAAPTPGEAERSR